MNPATTLTGVTPLLKHFAAYICLAAGTAGLVMPILPGIPILLLGFKLLGPDHRLTRRAVNLLQRLRARMFGRV